MKKGHLFVLSGPAGVGKGTLRKLLFRAVPGLCFSVSCTTRPPRPNEEDGRDYYFIDAGQFERHVKEDAFLEWAEVHGNLYGTRLNDVKRCLDAGGDMVLEIDVQGCRQVKAHIPEAIRIFITAPSLEELGLRLEERGTETPEQLDIRLRNAAEELTHAAEYEHIIVNDDVEIASGKLISLVRSYMEPDAVGGEKHDLHRFGEHLQDQKD